MILYRKDGEWGGYQELCAAAEAFGITIYVHQVEGPRFVVSGSGVLNRSIHVSYHGEMHYNSVRLADDLTYESAKEIVSFGGSKSAASSEVKTITKGGDGSAASAAASSHQWCYYNAQSTAISTRGQGHNDSYYAYDADHDSNTENQIGEPNNNRID